MPSPTLPGADDREKLNALCTFNYKDQAVWYLNGFWDKHEQDAEKLYQYVAKFAELDLEKGKDGSDLDELNAHRFLEAFNETLSVRDMRDKLRQAGCIAQSERPKRVPLVHFLLFKFNSDWEYLVHSPQGDNSEGIRLAQEKLNAVLAAYAAAEAAAAEARRKENDARSRAIDAKNSEEAAYAAAEDAKKKVVEQEQAKVELEVALAEVQKEEDKYNQRTEELKTKSETGGMVSRNKAKNELAQHLGEDPLPLRKAKITAEAAVKRAERAKKAAEDAAVRSEDAAQRATEARHASEAAAADAEQARAASEAALEEVSQKVKEAEDFLETEKSKPGQAFGALWWIERELTEAKKYKPLSRGGIAR